MTIPVPVFEAAQHVAYVLFGANYLQQWPLASDNEPFASVAKDFIWRKQKEILRKACDHLYDGIKNGTLTLWGVSQDGSQTVQVPYFILQYSNPYHQVCVGRIISEEYHNCPRVKPFVRQLDNFSLFVYQSDFDTFIRQVSGAAVDPVASATTSSLGTNDFPRGKKDEAFRWFDQHHESYQGRRGEKTRMYGDCADAICISFDTAKTYAHEWRKARRSGLKGNW